ncbi:hypothetical protein D8B27_18025, partial [Verminephrobacter aporrectodeae subsp. tuberculatae]|nr:hypothetical protein [Verminephrobacter aporrectodeae subsp. tuberculatae]
EFVHEPDLEEAAILFANGDHAGAGMGAGLLGAGAGPRGACAGYPAAGTVVPANQPIAELSFANKGATAGGGGGSSSACRLAGTVGA